MDGHERLRSNAYPGRGIVLGLDETGRFALQFYWITARSASSKNRVLFVEDGDVRTRPFEESARSDDPNIYYRAMASTDGLHVVSNGNHTDSTVEHLARGGRFEGAVRAFSYETDAPNFTPRIAGLTSLRPRPVFWLASAIRGRNVDTVHAVYAYGAPRPGLGYCLHTYAGDGSPLPSFTERPYEFQLEGSPDEVAARLWELLPPDRRVAMVFKAIDVRTREVVALSVRNTLG